MGREARSRWTLPKQLLARAPARACAGASFGAYEQSVEVVSHSRLARGGGGVPGRIVRVERTMPRVRAPAARAEADAAREEPVSAEALGRKEAPSRETAALAVPAGGGRGMHDKERRWAAMRSRARHQEGGGCTSASSVKHRLRTCHCACLLPRAPPPCRQRRGPRAEGHLPRHTLRAYNEARVGRGIRSRQGPAPRQHEPGRDSRRPGHAPTRARYAKALVGMHDAVSLFGSARDQPPKPLPDKQGKNIESTHLWPLQPARPGRVYDRNPRKPARFECPRKPRAKPCSARHFSSIPVKVVCSPKVLRGVQRVLLARAAIAATMARASSPAPPPPLTRRGTSAPPSRTANARRSKVQVHCGI